MNYWLFKSEPDTWSWDQQVARGAAGEEWGDQAGKHGNSSR